MGLFILCGLCMAEVSAQTTSYTKAESFLYSFKESNDMFLADYGDNAYQLERMGQRLPAFRSRLLAGGCHLLIVSHVSAYDSEEDAVINEASLRAARIRAYLKTRLDIPGECVAFYIDRSGNYRDQVHAYLVESPLPWFANTDIRYSESRYPNAVTAAIRRYGEIPFVDLYSRGSSGGYERCVYVITDPLFDRSELEDYRLATVIKEPDMKIQGEADISEDAAGETNGYPGKTPPVVVRRKPASGKQPPVKPRKPVSDPATSFLAVKTNLLPWATVAPSMLLGTGNEQIITGSFMPNLEVEYYFGGRWSVALGSMYADFDYKDKKRGHWAISSVTLTPKFWPLATDEYRWLNTGVFCQYGDFDVRGALIEKAADNLFGRTGRFISFGASVGCLIPLGAGFCTEASLSAGYRSIYDGKRYRHDFTDGKNYLESRFSSTGFMIGLNISLLYRFGFK